MSEILTDVPVRSGTTTAWADSDATDGDAAPVLAAGEIGIDVTKGQIALGDGTSTLATLLAAGAFRKIRVVTLTALVAGTKTVADTAITANSVIIPILKSLGTITVPKAVACTTRTASTSYVITSADNTDTSIYQVLILEP